ncbi:GTP cyclohydrolase II [Nocardia sp. NPDC048505]|uniref:GTP cyclohydrolase II n=1 Tax=unclassified Nocardia TaxID=2637762 RepID=UPI0033CFFF46
MPLRVSELREDSGELLGYILAFGTVTDGCLVRIHSRCLYGESLRSDDCDCGPELDKALDLIQQAGHGVLVYLEQEGRGLGLIAKARGYRHSEQTGADTFASYEALGYPADARNYDLAAEHLRKVLELRSVQLLTNNPVKAEAVARAGIAVTPVPLGTRPLSERARAYLEAKRRRRGHWIPADYAPWAAAAVDPAADRALVDTAVMPALPPEPACPPEAAPAPVTSKWRIWPKRNVLQPQAQQREVPGDLPVG